METSRAKDVQETLKCITTGEISFQQQKPYHCCVITLGLLEDYSLTFFKGAVVFLFFFFSCAEIRKEQMALSTKGIFTPLGWGRVDINKVKNTDELFR